MDYSFATKNMHTFRYFIKSSIYEHLIQIYFLFQLLKIIRFTNVHDRYIDLIKNIFYIVLCFYVFNKMMDCIALLIFYMNILFI